MENASDALLIAGTILIALIVLSMGVYLVSTNRVVTDTYNEKQVQQEIERYNTNFAQLEGREDVTIQEIVTLVKFTSQYCRKMGIEETKIYINGSKINTGTILPDYGVTEMEYQTPTIDPSGDKATFNYYICTSITYGGNGRIEEIRFRPTHVKKQ